MKETRSEKRHLSPILWLLLLAAILTTGVLSIYVARSGTNDQTRVAKFVFDTSVEHASGSISLEEMKQLIQEPGDQAEFNVLVTNSRSAGAEISEVAEQYTIEMTINGSMPLECTLKKASEPNPVLQIGNTGVAAASGSTTGTLAAGVNETQEYLLTVLWPISENEYKYANGTAVGELMLDFTAVQMD